MNDMDVVAATKDICARNSVTLESGCKLSVSGDVNYRIGTNPNMRNSYDSDLSYVKLNVLDYASTCGCEEIYKTDSLKSATLEEKSHIQFEPFEIELEVFPNPVNEELTVTSNSRIKNITIVNTVGEVQMEVTNLETGSYVFDTSCLAAGVYILKAKTHDGHEKTEKIIKTEKLVFVSGIDSLSFFWM